MFIKRLREICLPELIKRNVEIKAQNKGNNYRYMLHVLADCESNKNKFIFIKFIIDLYLY